MNKELIKLLATDMPLHKICKIHGLNESTVSNQIWQHSAKIGRIGRYGLVLHALKTGIIKTDDIWLK